MYINEVENVREFASLLGVDYSYLTYILYKKQPEKCYKSFEIPKKAGKTRIINAPVDPLKFVQQRLSDQLWKYELYLREKNNINSKISHAFEKDKSIFTNARIHKCKKYIVNLDLKDYFNSIHFGRVRGYFTNNNNYRLSLDIATIIAQLTCYHGYLPQGAPSSPIITNLISNIMDIRLLSIAKKYRLNYTRYADDLTFSTNDTKIIEKFDAFLNDVDKIVRNSGFSLNEEKTRLQYFSSRQVVTGLVVNKKLNISRNYYKDTRAMAHSLYTKGKFIIDSNEGTLSQLEGRFSFINQIDKYNNNIDLSIKKRNFRTLNNHEEQYRRFLFFKYFYFNEKPLIITEGKTDILYIKAALKKLNADYPELVKKQAGDYNFKLAFLKRSTLLEYLFGFGKDGADSMKNLYNYFNGNNGFKDYYHYFQKISVHKSICPIIFIFDNEMNNKNKPLYNFINHINISNSSKKLFEDKLYISLIENGNLFLATNHLVKDKSECEIEDLFDDELLELKLGNKVFDRSGKKDSKKYYSKDIFSKYVMKNYDDINFERFRPFLNNLNAIIKLWNNDMTKPS